MTALIALTQNVSLLWQIAYTTALILHIAVMLGYRSNRLHRALNAAARIHQELWLFAPAGLVVNAVIIWNGPVPWMIVFSAFGLLVWWQARKWPDDNVWKRRGKKLRDKVAVSAGRLVVVPAGASS